jgi:hypothetical protein
VFLEHQFQSATSNYYYFYQWDHPYSESRIRIPLIPLNPLTSLITSRHDPGTTSICYEPGAKLGRSTSKSLSARISQSENDNRPSHKTRPITEGCTLQGFHSTLPDLTEVYHKAIRLLGLRLLIWRNYKRFFCQLHSFIKKEVKVKKVKLSL